MTKVKVDRYKVLEIIKKNREEHRNVFLKAQEGYLKTAVELLQENLERAKKSRGDYRINFNLYPPVDQTREYDMAIGMLEMSVDAQIELTQQEYMNYVKDEWNWTRQFAHSNKGYVAAAGGSMPAKYQDYEQE